MRFFIMKQDTHFSQGIKLLHYDTNQYIASVYHEARERLKDVGHFYLNINQNTTMNDYLESPVYLISEKLKVILELLEDDLAFRVTTLIDYEGRKQYDYYQMFFGSVDAKSDKTEYYPNREEKRIVLSAEKIGEHQVFLLEDSRMIHPIVSLTVVESLLRRKATGIIFEELEVEAYG